MVEYCLNLISITKLWLILKKELVLLNSHKRISRLFENIKMKRININTQQTHFIGCWNLEDSGLCNEIIQFFNNNKNLRKQGVTFTGKNLNVKSRIDISVNPNNLKNKKFAILKRYINELHKCYLDYQNQWSFLKSMLKDIGIGRFKRENVVK